jgi:uncharacterized protein YhfF
LQAPDGAKVLAFWQAFKADCGTAPDRFAIGEFGNTPALADHLVDLIRRGIKTATSSTYQSYLDEKEPLPQAGSFFVAVDARGEPACVCQVTEVRVGPLGSVDAAFASEEGEGDRSRAAWMREHRRFFGLPALPVGDDEETFLVLFERFRLVWPLDNS